MFVKALLATAVAAAVMFASSAASQSSPKGIAYFRAVTVFYRTEGVFPGATEVWREKILLLHEAKQVGTADIVCIHVTKTIRECFGTVILPLGRMKVLGEINNRTLYQLAIVGGIGFYSGANGVAIFALGLVTLYIT